MKSIEKRKGTIKLPRRLTFELEPHVLSAIFGKFFPVNVQWNGMRDELIYDGFSPEFDELDEGCIYPIYRVEMRTEVNEERQEVIYDVNFIKE